MSVLAIHDDRLTLRFTVLEHLLGTVRDLDVPLASVVSVEPLASWRERRGLRVGLGLPGVRLLGRWVLAGPRQLVDLRRDVPALKIVLRGAGYDEVLVSTPDAAAVEAGLRARLRRD